MTLREVCEGDAAEIVQAFERLSADSRYDRFMQRKKQLNQAALERGVNPQAGRDFVLLATRYRQKTASTSWAPRNTCA